MLEDEGCEMNPLDVDTSYNSYFIPPMSRYTVIGFLIHNIR